MARPKKAKKALNETDEGNIPDTTPVTEDKPSEEVTLPEDEAELTGEVETEGEEAETEEEVPEAPVKKKESKKGYSQRVRELVKERDTEKAKAQSLAEKMAELTGSVEPQAGIPQPSYTPPESEPIVAPGEELDAAELERRLQVREQRILQRADALATIRTKQQDAINRVNNEAVEAIRDYPELDPESDSFDEELSESVTEAVEAHVKANPYSASVKNVVGKLMKPYKRAVTKEVGKAKENLAKQVSQAALKPTSIKPKGKSVDDMSTDELEEKLGVVY